MLQTFSQSKLQTVSALAKLREEWQQAAEGTSLLEMEANVGLMLADLVNSLGLSVHEQTLVLGAELFNEVSELLNQPPVN